MIEFKRPDSARDDYEGRFRVLEDAGLIRRPDRRSRRPIWFDRPAIDELGLAFFTAWIFRALLADKVGVGFVPADAEGRSTAMVLFELRPPKLVHPRRAHDVGGIDRRYFGCPLDGSRPELPARALQIFCPVLNRTRLNLSSTPDPAVLELTPKSEVCCAGRKQPWWDYVARNVIAEPRRYGMAFGGTVISIGIACDVLGTYIGGLDEDRGDWGKFLDEVLLWHALDASGATVGQAHAETKRPFASFEIDFCFWSDDSRAGGSDLRDLCVFETTVSHGLDEPRDDVEDAEPSAPRRPGTDRAKNKLVNHLALQSVGLDRYEYHYLHMVETAQTEALDRALRKTQGFHYWKHTADDLGARVRAHFEAPVEIGEIRGWYSALVERVREISARFAGR